MNPQNQMNTPKIFKEICIPRIETYIKKAYIKKVITKLNIGKIVDITETPLYTNTYFKKVIIQIEWNRNINTSTSENIYNRLNSGQSVNLVHNENEPWYWKIFLKR